MALALGGVGAVGEEDGDERDDQQRQRARVVDDDHGGGEAEARVGRRDREVHQQHAPERLGAESRPRTARSRRRSAARSRTPTPGWRSARRSRSAGRSRRPSPARLWKTITARQVVSVNCAMLKTTLIAGRRRSMQQHDDRPDQPGDDEVDRRGEQQAEDEREVAERERVGAAAEVQVDHAALGGEEAERQAPPRDVDADVELGQVLDGAGEQERREAVTIAMLSAQTPRSADNRRRAPFPGDMGGSSAARARTLKYWTDVRRESAQRRRAQQQVAREARRCRRTAPSSSSPVHVAHDPRPLPRLLPRAADAPQREEVVGGAEQPCRPSRSARRRAGTLISVSTRLEDRVDLLVVAALRAVAARREAHLVPGQHQRVREVVVDVRVHAR